MQVQVAACDIGTPLVPIVTYWFAAFNASSSIEELLSIDDNSSVPYSINLFTCVNKVHTFYYTNILLYQFVHSQSDEGSQNNSTRSTLICL